MGINALFSGTTGLQSSSTELDVVGNNLANLNTVGYKSQTTLFQDTLYQTLSTGSPGTSTSGGRNPTQVGFGVTVGQIQTSDLQGNVTPTGQPLDAAIQGNGFFVVQRGNETSYTRSGSFGVDSNGFLVDPATGANVQRYGTVGEPTLTAPGFQVAGDTRIRIPYGAGSQGIPTQNVNYQGNISSTLQIGQAATTTTQFFDSLSEAQSMTVTFTPTAANTYDVGVTVPNGTVTLPATPTTVTFDNSGNLLSPATIAIGISGLPGTSAQTVNLNFGTVGQATGLSQYGGVTTAAALSQDGISSGVLTSVSIDSNGNVQGQFSNGQTLPVAQLAVAGFNNSSGLIRNGNNYFSSGPASGNAIVGVANQGGNGAVQGGALEGSNVDVSAEFSKLIIAQRAYQINAKTVSAVDQELQTLANIIQ